MNAAKRRPYGHFVLLLTGAAISLFFWGRLRNPKVELASPRIVSKEAAASDEIVVLLGGDFAPTDHALEPIAQHGYRYPYLATAEHFQKADIAMANLEAPVTRAEETFWPYKDWLYKVDPVALDAFDWLGLDAVSLANNHLIDYRRRGMVETFENLQRAGLPFFGAGMDETEARRPLIFDVDGTRIGFLAYLEHRLAYNLYLNTFAIDRSPGCAQLNRRDVEEDLKRLRPLVDILIVSVHWGLNYKPITSTQEQYARLFASLGADLVAGHHPHDVQPVEQIEATTVLYSLGNYAWGARGHDNLRVGFLARMYIQKRAGREQARIRKIELVPMATQNRIVNYQPRLLQVDEHGWLDEVRAESRARGIELALAGSVLEVVPIDQKIARP